MTSRFVALLVGFLISGTATAQHSEWRIFDRGGNPAAMEDVVRASADVKVVLVGELHDDEAGHRFQLALLEALDRDDPRMVSLSLEMFERDVQLVLDEFLAGHISDAHFRASARPWPNYERDYRPLVEYARRAGLPVVAANVPRRYVNLVAREGIDAVESLFGQARAILPSLPLPDASPRYREMFMARTSGMHGHGGPPPENMFEAQLLWDAGMADAIVREMARDDNRLIVHLAGSFHVEEDTGIPDMIRAYRPGTAMLSIVIRPAAGFDSDEHGALGDFIVITPEATADE